MRRESLIQLPYRRRPWRMLVCCILLNRTRGQAQVRPVLGELFRLYPDAEAMAAAGPELEELIRPLGLWRRRAGTLRRFSAGWVRIRHARFDLYDLRGLPGVGPYAIDAYRLVCLGDLDHFYHQHIHDPELRRYWNWAVRDRERGRREHIEELARRAHRRDRIAA